MRVLYLFSGIRGELVKKVARGEDPGGGTWGMLALQKIGVDARFVELEQWVSPKTATFLRRRILGNYGAHFPFFFNFFSYDIIFTASAFTSQLCFTLFTSVFRFRRPLWVMHDFSIKGMLGVEQTFKQKVFSYIVARAGGIVTLGMQEKNMLEERFPHLKERIAFIPFGVDTDFFSPQNHIQEEKLIIAVGVDPDRDWNTFFSACEGIDAKVIIAGSTERKSKNFKYPSWITIRRFEPKEMVELYARAAVVVLPLDTSTGINDAMGCSTLYEGLSMGKAMVISRTHHMESYITNGENGLLVEQKNVSDMRSAILNLLENESLRKRIGEASRTYALEKLNLMDCAQQLAIFFKHLLSYKK